MALYEVKNFKLCNKNEFFLIKKHGFMAKKNFKENFVSLLTKLTAL